MHHFIYPSQDTFITNTIGYDDLNFGLDEVLRVGTQDITSKVTQPTTIYQIAPSGSFVTNLCVQGFSGSLSTASFYGSASTAVGRIFNTSVDPVSFSTSYFSGSFVGSAIGWNNGTYISASNATGSLTNFSGTIVVHTISSGSTWDGLIFEYNNWFTTWDSVISGSGVINGVISGSLSGSFIGIFNGYLIGFTGKILVGNIDGVDVKNVPHTEVIIGDYKNRALVQFDITSISKSIANGDIVNPQFNLKLNIAREFNLPIGYNVYAFPISQSWVMGDGYVSDNGSTDGASWIYRDYQNGTPWAVTGSSYIQSLSVTQSFNYQVGDINMNVTPIVNAWLNGTIKNNGIVLISSDEFSSNPIGMCLFFFSKDTNTIYEPILDVGWSSGSGGWSWSTGSVVTASANISTVPAGLYGSLITGSAISGSLYGGFTGIGNMNFSSSVSYSYTTSSITGSIIDTASFTSYFANGLASLTGVNGLIISMSIIGNFSGSLSHSIVPLINKCGTCEPVFNVGAGLPGGQNQTQYQGLDIYGWGNPFNTFNQYNWPADTTYDAALSGSCSGSMVTMSYVMGTFIDGTMPGATFTSSLIHGYIFGYGYLVGSWNESLIIGSHISASYPFLPLWPVAMNVLFTGSYVNGPAFGSITNFSTGSDFGSDYGIFDGVFTGGPLVGIHIHAPFSGSILNAPLLYTSSINLTSSSLSPVNVNSPFVAVVQNVPDSVNAGDIIRINVFGRQQFPLKNFNRQTQFTQFLTPQYLPSSSYYSIKDNETEQIILDFDNYTQISCDSNGNYFYLDTTAYPQERYFRLLIRVEASGSIYTFDKGNIFKIVR